MRVTCNMSQQTFKRDSDLFKDAKKNSTLVGKEMKNEPNTLLDSTLKKFDIFLARQTGLSKNTRLGHMQCIRTICLALAGKQTFSLDHLKGLMNVGETDGLITMWIEGGKINSLSASHYIATIQKFMKAAKSYQYKDTLILGWVTEEYHRRIRTDIGRCVLPTLVNVNCGFFPEFSG